MTIETTTIPADPTPVLNTGITARINGADRICEIRRKDIRFFESIYGSSLAIFNRIRNGEWCVEELRAVISFATGPHPTDSDMPDLYRSQFIALDRISRANSSWIDDAFDERGPANYVPLALGIIAAALWGVPADEAVFTDGSEPADGD